MSRRRPSSLLFRSNLLFRFFFNDTATTEIYPLSLHDPLPISINAGSGTITMSAPGNIALTGLSTTNNSAAAVSVSSSAGAITDAGDTTTDITAAGAAAVTTLSAAPGIGSAHALGPAGRSGGRRVGEEGRSPGAPEH